MGTILSVFAAAKGAPIVDTREVSGADGTTSVVDASVETGRTPEQASAKIVEQQATEVWPPDNCGIEDYGTGVEVRDWEGPQRIKETRLTAEQKTMFRGILARVFHADSIMGVKTIFPPDEVMAVATTVIEYLKSEPLLIEDVPFGVNIVGDLHGQLYDLDRVFKGDAKDGKPGWECAKYVFMGDYVDRGRQSLEIMMALFCIKMLYPDRIFLLRGNHEFININMTYGLSFEIKERYELKTAKLLYKTLNEAFSWLSLAAIVGNAYYCAHAGIHPGLTRWLMRGMYKPFHTSFEDIGVLDVTWSDPALGLKGTTFNKDRNSSIFWGFDEACHFLASMDVVAIFRGHSMIKSGYDVAWNCVFTIFTATAYQGDNNVGAVALIDEQGKVGFRILEVVDERTAWEKKLRALEFKPKAVEEEEKTQNDLIEKNTGKIAEI